MAEVLKVIGEQLMESGQAIPGGLADITYRNIWERIKGTAQGIREVLGGIIGEPLKAVGKSFERMGELRVGTAVLEIMNGVRQGVQRVLQGTVNIVAEAPKAVSAAVGGAIRTVAGVTGLVGLGGDVKKLEGDGGTFGATSAAAG